MQEIKRHPWLLHKLYPNLEQCSIVCGIRSSDRWVKEIEGHYKNGFAAIGGGVDVSFIGYVDYPSQYRGTYLGNLRRFAGQLLVKMDGEGSIFEDHAAFEDDVKHGMPGWMLIRVEHMYVKIIGEDGVEEKIERADWPEKLSWWSLNRLDELKSSHGSLALHQFHLAGRTFDFRKGEEIFSEEYSRSQGLGDYGSPSGVFEKTIATLPCFNGVSQNADIGYKTLTLLSLGPTGSVAFCDYYAKQKKSPFCNYTQTKCKPCKEESERRKSEKRSPPSSVFEKTIATLPCFNGVSQNADIGFKTMTL
jgi:hypothetical protein